VLTGRIGSGSTLNASLLEQGVSATTVDRIVGSMRPVFDFRHAHPGDFFALVQDDDGLVLSFEFQRGRRDVYRLRTSKDGGLAASHEEVPLERRVVRLSGVVSSSIFDTMIALGEEPDLVNKFTDIFAWDLDFSKETKPGDDFRIVFEKFFDRDGFVRYGKILAGQYRTGHEQLVAIHFEDEEGSGDYYHPDGTSVRRSFLRAPLRYTRISSRYSKSRLHPILNVRRPHEGVDYAAPVGTPVWSVADGTVIFKGWSGGFGRLVKIRHNNGWISYYGHLSSYADGVRVGRRVRQQDPIGYVGATGLATGPHLDYRLKVDGRFIDPLRAELPNSRPISVRNLARFAPIRDARLSELAVVGPAAPLASRR
jgi:murein DD-endopeptidase MepM/ murein hydrolase activator NlpD